MSDVEWCWIDPAARASIALGDLVSAEAGGLPVYEVVSIADGRVWLREEISRRDHIMSPSALRWKLRRCAATW